MPATEAIRARALASPIVGEAYNEVLEAMRVEISAKLQEAYRLRGIEPEIPTYDMAMIMLMAAQFIGSQRALGNPDKIASVETYLKSLFAISAEGEN